MMVFSEQKRQYMGKDMQEWLAWWQIELNWPAKFPIRSVLPLRAAIVQPAVWHHICTTRALRSSEGAQPHAACGRLTSVAHAPPVRQ